MKSTKDPLLRLLSIWSLVLLLSTASGHIHSPDGEVNYRTALSLSRFQGYSIDPLPDGFLTREGRDGRQYPQYGPLQPLLSVPFVWLGDLTAMGVPASWFRFQSERLGSTVSMYRLIDSRWANFAGFYPEDRAERVRRAVFSFFNPVVTWLTVLLLAVWGRRFESFGRFWWFLPVVYLLGTYAWAHSRPSYTEPLATLLLLASAYLAWRSQSAGASKSLSISALAVGILSACAVLTRLDSAVALPGILLIAAGSFTRSQQRTGTKIAALSLGAIAFLALSSWIPIQNLLRFGSFLASGYEDQVEGIQFDIPLSHALWIYLISAGKGIFWYSPPLIAALLAWPLFFRKDRFLCLGFIWIFLAYLLIIGKWQNLGGWCWGPRHLFQVTPFLLFPLPLLFSSDLAPSFRSPNRILLPVTLAMGFLVQVMGVLVDYMWPLDKALRLVPSEQHTQKILSLEFYGPILHWRTWRLDRDPDWLLADLFRSGEIGARILSGMVWLALILTTILVARHLLGRSRGFSLMSRSAGKEAKASTPSNDGSNKGSSNGSEEDEP